MYSFAQFAFFRPVRQAAPVKAANANETGVGHVRRNHFLVLTILSQMILCSFHSTD